MKYVIVGGSAGGATTLARLRRIDERAEIVLIEKSSYVSYANCGLPYYVGGEISERDALFLNTPEGLAQRFNADIRINTEVVHIDRENKKIELLDKDGKKTNLNYDKLLLSTGASPLRPNIKGIETDGIFTLRSVDDTDNIKNYLSNNKITSAVIVGAGFIGLEMAENLSAKGIDVTIVEKAPQVMPTLDYSTASIVHEHLQQKGVWLYLGEEVSGFQKTDKIDISLKSGEIISADMVLLSIGVMPDTSIAEKSGLDIGIRNSIVVNNYLQTSDDNIYAIGDAISYKHPITAKAWCNLLAGPANRQARICADNMALGNNIEYEGAIGTAMAKVFDLTVASVGLSERQLKLENIEYKFNITHSYSHAGYYPGSSVITIKLLFSPDEGIVLGAQIIGFDGVDKRIDVIASVIKNNGSIYDLMKIEQAYAPPYSSAKDPVAIAGYAAENILKNRVKVLSWRQLSNADNDKTLIVDVRTPEEFALGHIPEAVNIPLDIIRNSIDQFPKDKSIHLYCAIGLRGYIAYRILEGHGYKSIYNLSGGYRTYYTSTSNIVRDDRHRNVVVSNEGYISRNEGKVLKINACGLQCPGPIVKLKESMDTISAGDEIEINATDPGFARDVQSWCKITGHSLISCETNKNNVLVRVLKNKSNTNKSDGSSSVKEVRTKEGKTFIMFSDDMDKVLATMVLANGAATTGKKVTIFFTFWGLNVIKKDYKPKVKKDFFGKMFTMMLPKNIRSLSMSKFNMFGAGPKMMNHIMKKRGVDSIEKMRTDAIKAGVEFIACQMSMDVMGIKREELLDEVTIGGVATYMERAESAGLNLFI